MRTNSFVVYLIGVVVVMCALAYGGHLLGVSDRWVGIGITVGLGLGIMAAVGKSRKSAAST